MAARAFAERVGIDGASRSRLVIIIEELVTNFYDHGGLGMDDAIELELSANEAKLSLALIAPGPPFDPRHSVPRKPGSSGAGAGLKLVKAWTRTLSHTYHDGRNRLELTLLVRR